MKRYIRAAISKENANSRAKLAGTPYASAREFAKYAQDESVTVRRRVAGNRNTPTDILDKLANDPDSQVRWAVAHNRNTPAETLLFLASDTRWDGYAVPKAVAANPSAPAEALAVIAQKYKDAPGYLYLVAKHKNTPPDVLLALSQSNDAWIRDTAKKNPKCPR